MSTKTAVEHARKRVVEFVKPSPFLAREHRADFPRHTDILTGPSVRLSHHGAEEPSFGHDFSRIGVHSEAEGTYQVPQSCPLRSNSPRYCPLGGACHTCPTRIQTKLAINQPRDHYEQEADGGAEALAHMPESSVSVRTPDSGRIHASNVPPIVHEVLRSPGQPLDPATCTFMESRFGYDFNWVRIHNDAKTAKSARAVNALAYTVGYDIMFGAGQYAPRTREGRKLLAHELTHVIQQCGKPMSSFRGISSEASVQLSPAPPVMREWGGFRIYGDKTFRFPPPTCGELEGREERIIQSKLIIHEPGDKYEQEADRIARNVVYMPEPPTLGLKKPDGANVPKIQLQADAEREPTAPPAVPSPETATKCSVSNLGRLNPVLERARLMAFKAFFGLQSLLLGYSPKLEVEKQLRNHFLLSRESAEAETVLDRFRVVFTRLSDIPQFRCAQAGDPNCEQFGAYVVSRSPFIFLCPSFFDSLSTSNHKSPWVLVHEVAHLSGAWNDHARFISPGAPPTCDARTPLSPAQAIDNADSYAFFAFCVSR